jgi:hypothetical protein
MKKHNIFLRMQVGWCILKSYKGFDERIALEFLHNLQETRTEVRWIQIAIDENVLAIVTRLLQVGGWWYSRKIFIPDFKEDFLQENETW